MTLHDRVDVFITGKEALVNEVQLFIANKDLPLDDRWALFDKAESLLPIDSWVITLNQIEKNGYEWYDDFNYERFETVKFTWLLDKVLDYPEKYKKIVIRDLMEEILSTGVAGFKYDW